MIDGPTHDRLGRPIRKDDPDKFRYIFLRTRLATEDYMDQLGAFYQPDLPEVSVLEPLVGDDDGWEFTNGAVLRVRSSHTAAELAERYREALSRFDVWAIHDAMGDAVEGPISGLVESYFRANPARRRSAMVFLFDKDGEQRAGENADRLRGLMPPECAPVFHFQDGRVLMAPGPLPFRIIANKVGASAQRFAIVAGVDGSGVDFQDGQETESLWRSVDLLPMYIDMLAID